MRLFFVIFGFYLSVLPINIANAVPSGSRLAACSRLDCSGTTKFQYVSGKTYSYRYETDVVSYVNGINQNKESRIHFAAKVHFDVETPCDWTLRISDVSLQDSEPSDATRKSSVLGEIGFKEVLEKFSMPFTFDDGKIPNICPSADEPIWSVNIKRGILSAFQNTMPRFDLNHDSLESDVSGTCKVNYAFYGAVQNAINVLKTHDLSSCTNRYLTQSLKSVPYQFFGGGSDSIPLVNSTSSCQQTIAGNRIVQSECEEKHVLRPFSHDGSGATTSARQNLIFLDESQIDDDVDRESISNHYTTQRRTSLLYQHVIRDSKASSPESATLLPAMLQRLCQNTEEGIESEAAATFGRLVKALRTLDYSSLGSLLAEADVICRDGEAARKHLLNGLISASTSDAIAAMKDEIITGKVDTELVNRLVASLGFISRPTVKHLEAALPLLDVTPYSRQASLSVSSLANKLCTSSCPSEVNFLVGKLVKQLGNSCETRSREEREETTVALLSLANIGEAITGDHLNTVKKCFQEQDNPIEIRVAALKTFRNIPCHSRGDAALKILQEATEDSEVRIAAYLSVMKCVDYQTFLDIKDLLKHEEVNQVGSFIWTHLKNLASSSLPSKLNSQAIVLDQSLADKFQTDGRKFSRNYEKSIFIDQWNAAVSLENNIIFSQQSYLPRSTFLNLTVDMFGRSVNLLEFDGRIEGFESYLQSLFGPGGSYHHKEIGYLLENLRPKRKINPSKLNTAKLQAIDNQFNADSRYKVEPKMSLSMKLFGSDLGYGQWEGEKEILSLASQLSPTAKLSRLMNGQDIHYDYAAQVIDTTHAMPLAVGLPLNMMARAEVMAEVRGNMRTDLKALLTKGAGEMMWKIHPSASITFNGEMVVDAVAFKAGVTLQATLHSSVSTSGKFAMNGIKLIDLQVDLPQEKAELINFKSDIILHHRTSKVPLQGIDNKVEFSYCTRGPLQRFLGLQLCTEVAYYNASDNYMVPHFPLNGPSLFSVKLEKADPTIKSYRFLHKITNENNLKSWELTFRPQGGQGFKDIGFKGEIEYKENDSGVLALGLMLPSNSYDMKGIFKWNDESKAIEATLMRDEQNKLLIAKASLDRSVCKKQTDVSCFYPKLALTVSNRKLIDLGGEISLVEKTGTRKYGVDINSTFGTWRTATKGSYLVDETSHQSNLKIDYGLNSKSRPESLKVEIKVNKEMAQGLHQLDFQLGVEPSAHPNRNFFGAWRLQHGSGHLQNTLTLNIGPLPRDNRNTLTIQQGFSYAFRRPSESLKFRSHFQMTLPAKNLDIGLVIGHEQSDYKTDSLFIGKYAPGKELQCGLLLVKKPGIFLQANGEFNLTLPSQPIIRLTGKVREQTKHNYKVDVDGVWGKETDFQLNGSYDNQIKTSHSTQQLSLELTGSSIYPTEFVYTFQTNSSALEVNVQSSYGKDAVSVYLLQERPAKDDLKIATKIGYLNYLHTVEAHWKGHTDGQEGTFDVHIDKVMDFRGDFSTLIAANGRRVVSLDVQLDPNRNPHQKLTAMASFEPSSLQSGNWNSTLVFKYPGSSISANVAALVQRNGRSLIGVIDLGSKKSIKFSASTALRPDGLVNEVIIETPFENWKTCRASLTSETKGLMHRTQLLTKWGKSEYFEVGVHAKAEFRTESKAADISLGWKSSIDELESFQLSAKTELQPEILENSLKILLGKNQEIALVSTMEWSFKNQFMLKSDISLMSPFPQLSQIKLQLYHNTEWDSARLSETRGTLIIEKQTYSILLKGENPDLVKRWEASALLTTPHPTYATIGLRTQYSADERQPSLDLQIYWPQKEIGMSFIADLFNEEQHRGRFHLQTPFEELRNLTIDGSCSVPSDPTAFKFDLGSRWNEVEYATLNATWDVESLINSDISADIKTSIPEHESYGAQLKLYLDLAEYPSANTAVVFKLPSNKVGLNVNWTMAEAEDGPSVAAFVKLDFGKYPQITVDINHDTKAYMEFNTTVLLSRGEQSVRLNTHTTTTTEGHFVASLGVMTPLERWNDFESRIRFLKKMSDANTELVYEAGMKWKEFNRENKVSGRFKYVTSVEDMEDATERSATKLEVIVISPWQTLQRASVKAELVSENSVIMPHLEAVFNLQNITIDGNIDFLNQAADITAAKKTTNSKPFTLRMNSTWALEESVIKAEGVLATDLPELKRVPWNIEITMVDSEEDENVWERIARGEVRLSNSQFILLNAALLPNKLNANIATPFQAFKNINVTVDYDTSSDSVTSLSAELRLNEDQMEITANLDWPQDNVLPASFQTTLNTPFVYEQFTCSWKANDPYAAAELLLSWRKKNQPSNFEIRYNLSEFGLEKIEMNLELQTGNTPKTDNWVMKLLIENTEKLTGSLTIATPYPQMRSIEISTHLARLDDIYKVSAIFDTKSISGKFLVNLERNDQRDFTMDMNLEVLQYCQLKLKFVIDSHLSDMNLNASAVWDPLLVQWELKSALKRSGWQKYVWNTELSSDSNQKWLVDLELDFADVTRAYSHKLSYNSVHDSAKYSTYGSLSIDDSEYRGQIGVTWGDIKPIELKFTNKKIAKQLGNAVIEILTPWTNETTLIVDLTVDARQQPVEFKINAEVAERIVIVGLNIKYASLDSMMAKTVVTTVYPVMPRTSFDFSIHRRKDAFNGSYVLEWSEGNVVDLHVFREEKDEASLLTRKNVKGLVTVKSSWSRMPEVSVHYIRQHKSPTVLESGIILSHNFTEVVNIAYKSNIRSSAGQEDYQGQLEMRGTVLSGGLAFGRTYRYSAGRDGDNFPRSLNRTVEVFEIGKRPHFSFRAQLQEKETSTGKENAIVLSTPLRSIEFRTHTDLPDGVFKHGSEFRWRPDAKVAYEIEVENKTSVTATDYVMTTTLITPVRSLGLTGTMRQTKRTLRANGEVVWDLKRRDSLAKVTLTWENATKTRDIEVNRLKLGFSQGNLPQELALQTEIRRSKMHPLSMRTEIQYSNEPQRKLVIDTLVTTRPKDYRYEMNMTHKATQLELRQILAYERNEDGRAQVMHRFSHSRSDTEPMELEHLFAVDQKEKKLLFSASSPTMTLRHVGQMKQSDRSSSLTYEIQQDDATPRTAELIYGRRLPFAKFVAHYDPENMKSFHLKAGMQDKRQMILELFNVDHEERIPLFDFAFRLNHSRLITSRTQWQKDWRSRLIQGINRTRDSLYTTADQWVSAFVATSFSEWAGSLLMVADDIAVVLDTTLQNFDDEIEKLEADIQLMKQNIIDGYNANAFFAKLMVDIGGAIIQDIPFGSYAQSFVAFIEKTGDRILEPFTGHKDSFSVWLKELGPYFNMMSEAITSWIGENWKWPSGGSSKFLATISKIFRDMAEEYDRFMKGLHENLINSFPDIITPLRSLARDSWNGMYKVLRPVILRSFVAIESATWSVMKEVLDYLYKHQEAIMKSTYFQKLSYLLNDIKQFYSDMQSADWPSRLRKYITRAGIFLQQKYSDIDAYMSWLETLRKEVEVIYYAFLKENPELLKGAENWQKLMAFLRWSYDYLDINQKISDSIVTLREKGAEITSQTATDVQMRYTLQKTMFRFHPELGSIELEQKLPFPWMSLDEVPHFEQLPEIQRVRSIVSMFQPSNTSTVDLLLSYLPKQQYLADFLPPFKSSAHLTGLQHFITFDGRPIDFVGPCTYLLARDFSTHNFTLAIQYIGSRGKPYASVLQLIVEDAQWELDLANHTIRVAGTNRILPTEERGTAAFYENGKVIIESPMKGLRLECIAAYDTCTFTLSGWYHNKVSGLFGTLDNEPSTDLVRPNRVVDLDITSLARSWDVSNREDCKTVENLARTTIPFDIKLNETCTELFQSPRSTLKKCFQVVDPAPYLRMCLLRTRTKYNAPDGCNAAAAFSAACAAKGVLLRVPPHCVRCQNENNTLTEGEEFHLTKPENPSTDVVILLDLKKCNEPDAASRRFLPSLISGLDKELTSNKISKNRYALIVFGGTFPYDQPRIRTLNGKEFVAAKDMDSLLHNLSYGNGPSGVLGALRLASQLSFRPGVSKTIVLLPCASCESHYDPELTSQSLSAHGMTLHILTGAEFRFTKHNVTRQFLGLDANTGYTSKEFKGRLIGDTDLRRQARLSKSLLGVCGPMALETNGTIFAASRLRKNSSDSKKALNVWAKRVVNTARMSECVTCSCNLKNNYESGLNCQACIPKDIPTVDTNFLVDESNLPKVEKSPRSRSA